MAKAVTKAPALRQREEWLDIAKGLAIVLIVLGHVLRGLNNANMLPDDGWFKWADSFIYTFHVPAFFFISGYLLDGSTKRGAVAYYKGKVQWIGYPYVLWSLIQGAVNVKLSFLTNKPIGWGTLGKIWWQPLAQFWFLYDLFVLQALFYPLRKVDWRWLVSGSVVAFAVTAAFGISVGQSPLNAPYYALPMALGVAASREGWLKAMWKKLGAMDVVALWMIFAGVVLGLLSMGYRHGDIVLAPMAVVGVLALLATSVWMEKLRGAEWVAGLGRISMAVLVMHILAGSGARIVLLKIFHEHDVGLHIAAGLAAGVLAPAAAWWVMSRIGALRLAGLRG